MLFRTIHNRSSSEDGGFAYYKDISTNQTGLEDVSPSGWDHVYKVDIDEKVKWIETQCNPNEDNKLFDDVSAKTFKHMGGEWDWLVFYWNIFSGESGNPSFGISNMLDIWQNIPLYRKSQKCDNIMLQETLGEEYAYPQLNGGIRPWTCVPFNSENEYEFMKNSEDENGEYDKWHREVNIGTTWDDLVEATSIMYSKDKADLFRNTGKNSGLNFDD